MATRLIFRPLGRSLKPLVESAQSKAQFTGSTRTAQDHSKTQTTPPQEKYTHFGYENVREDEKQQRGTLSLFPVYNQKL